jgi:hypothetical protein
MHYIYLSGKSETHIDILPTSAANKNEDPLEDEDAELAMETASSSMSEVDSNIEIP